MAASAMLTAVCNENRLLMAGIFGDDVGEGQKYWKDVHANMNMYTTASQADVKMRTKMETKRDADEIENRSKISIERRKPTKNDMNWYKDL